MEFKKQLITPSIAKQYLEANIKNRRVRQETVNRYANDMINGKWKEDTGDSIKISKTGILIDGQHRLLSIIKANISINIHVATNVDDDVFDVLDTGTVRNATDVFLIKGIKNENSIPSIISFYELFKIGINTSCHKKDRTLTNSQLLIEYEKRPAFWQMVANKSHRWYLGFAKILPKSIIGGMYAIFYDINQDDSESFFDQIATGMDIKNKSIGLLRQKLMQDKMSLRKMPILMRNALIIKTWNYSRLNNNEIKLLKFNSQSEEFPIPV